MTGTPAGVGPVQPGQLVTANVDSLGNRCVAMQVLLPGDNGPGSRSCWLYRQLVG